MREGRSTLWLLMAVVSVAIIVFLLVRFGLNQEETPAVLLPSPASSDSLAGGADNENSLKRVEVTPQTVRAVLATLRRVDGYSRRISVETYWPGGSGRTELSVWVRGSSTRVAVDGGRSQQNILILDDTVYIWYEGSAQVYTGKAAADDADRWQNLITYEKLLTEDLEITDAGYISYGGEPCIYVAYTTPDYGYDCRLYISVGSGLLLGSETFDGSELIIRVTSSDLDITTPDDDIFLAPSLPQGR